MAATDRGDDLDALLRRGFDAAMVSFYTLAARAVPVLRAVSPRTRIAVDSVDVHFVRTRRAAEVAGDQVAAARANHGRAQELAVYAAADTVLTVTEDERALLAGLLPGADVQVLGNVHRGAETVAPLAGRRGSLFVGSYRHAPNADAVRWLCSDVMPLLRAAGHADPVVVAGANMPDDLAALATAAGAEPRGFLPSMEAELATRRISIAPLRFGAGLKGKVGESLAAVGQLRPAGGGRVRCVAELAKALFGGGEASVGVEQALDVLGAHVGCSGEVPLSAGTLLTCVVDGLCGLGQCLTCRGSRQGRRSEGRVRRWRAVRGAAARAVWCCWRRWMASASWCRAWSRRASNQSGIAHLGVSSASRRPLVVGWRRVHGGRRRGLIGSVGGKDGLEGVACLGQVGAGGDDTELVGVAATGSGHIEPAASGGC